MTNFEKYKDEIKKALVEGDVCSVVDLAGYKRCSVGPHCKDCRIKLLEWLESEYEEPQINWSNVKVDTPVLVSDNGLDWYKRYFAEFTDNKVYTFADGTTNWSHKTIIEWEYAKLAEEE